MDRHATVIVVEHGHELKPGTERIQVLAHRRDAHVVGMLELRDRPLRHVEPAGELGLTDRLTVTKLVEPNLVERLDAPTGETPGRAGLGDNRIAELGKLGSCHQIKPTLTVRPRAPTTSR